MKLSERILEIINSDRFWFVITGSAAFMLQDPETFTRPWHESLGRFVAMVSAGVAGIGTVDKLGRNIGKTEVQSKEDIATEKIEDKK
jgi:hypothetical protein